MDNSQKTVFALHKKYPDSEFLVNETYETLTWLTEKYPKPTEAEFNEAVKDFKDDYDAKKYQRDRQQEYPNTTDLIVALWEKVIEGRSESADALEVKRQEVKTAHPKPS